MAGVCEQAHGPVTSQPVRLSVSRRSTYYLGVEPSSLFPSPFPVPASAPFLPACPVSPRGHFSFDMLKDLTT